MKCQSCGEAEATIHFKEVAEGNLEEIHYCESCANEKGYHLVIEQNKLSIATQFIWMAENLYPESSAKQGAVQCTVCGLRYSQFTRTGRLGCPTCYEAFTAQLTPLLRRVHGATIHRGRSPDAEAPPVQDPARERLYELRAQLRRAVDREEYENAARLRDEIRTVEQSLQSRSGSNDTRKESDS